MTTDEILRAAADTYAQRHQIYGENWKKIGQTLHAMFPNGIELKTVDDHVRWYYLVLKVAKLTRYANNFTKGGHRDSIHDDIVYSAMLESYDKEVQERTK